MNFCERSEIYRTLTQGRGRLDLSQGRNIVKNGSFEDALAGWNVSLWREGVGGKTYEGADVRVVDAGAHAGDKCLRVAIGGRDFESVYGLSQSVPATPGKAYVLRYAWKRRLEGPRSARSLEAPRLRLTFSDANGKQVPYQGQKALWYETSNSTDSVTDWVVEGKVLRIETDSPIRRIHITFHFASEGENWLDAVELLE